MDLTNLPTARNMLSSVLNQNIKLKWPQIVVKRAIFAKSRFQRHVKIERHFNVFR